MHNRHLWRFGVAIVVLMAVFSLVALALLPPDSQVPIHWGAGMRPDLFLSRDQGLLLYPLLGTTGMGLWFALPRKRGDDPFGLSVAIPFGIAAGLVALATVHVVSVVAAWL